MTLRRMSSGARSTLSRTRIDELEERQLDDVASTQQVCAVLTTTIPLRFDRRSTAVRLLTKGHYGRSDVTR